MVLLNMAIGLFPFIIWSVGIVLIIIIEGAFLSKFLDKRWLVKKIIQIVAISNIITLILGLLNILNFFWTRTTEFLIIRLQIDQDQQALFRTGIIVLVTFLITLFTESIINIFFLVPKYKRKQIFLGTLYSNLITYTIITLVIIFLMK